MRTVLITMMVLLIAVLFGGCNLQKEKVQNRENSTSQEIGERVEVKEHNHDHLKEGKGGWEEADGEYYFLIPEMGIKFKVSEMKKDQYVYVYSKGVMENGKIGEGALFSTKKLMQDPSEYCKPEYAPSGSIVKYEGTIEDYKHVRPQIDEYKQFDDFLIFYSAPHATCTNNVSLYAIDHQGYTEEEKAEIIEKNPRTAYKSAELID